MLIICSHFSKAQTTNLGLGSGTGGTQNVYIGTNAATSATGERNVALGFESGISLTSGFDNVLVGHRTGIALTTGKYNTLIGKNAGYSMVNQQLNTMVGFKAGFNCNGPNNTFIGAWSGYSVTSGIANTFFGVNSGYSTTYGDWNSYFGNSTGYYNKGDDNTFMGTRAGYTSTLSHRNIIMGTEAGFNLTGNNNVYIGYRAGYNITGSNKLVIHNDSTSNALIYGEFDNRHLVFNSKVGINTNSFPNSVGSGNNIANTTNYGLFVKGGILADEVRVRTDWADYVFDNNYKLMPLNDLAKFIEKHKHLPNIPSAIEIDKVGISLGEIAKKQQEKIEELTLYLLQQQQQIDDLKKQVELLNSKK